MSKVIVEIHNYTDKQIGLGSRASGRADLGLPSPPGSLGKGKHPLGWNIPDNSDSSKYFDTNRITLSVFDPKTGASTAFSIWDDDWKNYDIYFCEGTDWKNTTRRMRGGDKGGNNAKIILHVAELPDNPGKYELTAFEVTDDQLTRNVLKEFQSFRNHPDINLVPGKKYTNDQIKSYMAHPAFKPVIDAANTSQAKSLAVIWGVEGTLVVGGELSNGILIGLDDDSVRAMATAAVCIGLDVGIDGFIGIYLTSSDPPGVAGLEFFAQIAVGYGPGISLVLGVTLSETHSRSVLVTAGIEVDFGAGAGWTKLGKA